MRDHSDLAFLKHCRVTVKYLLSVAYVILYLYAYMHIYIHLMCIDKVVSCKSESQSFKKNR